MEYLRRRSVVGRHQWAVRARPGRRSTGRSSARTSGLLHLSEGWIFQSRIRCGRWRCLMRGYL
ncbi:hypothetical protein HMPREF9056_00972 [Actinomyces sp. oral taxon 170 str. F0386]|nr:hypothetical protein HMPREF9056_00972 [Actinomyces sp. oral taxon 170 str. F0386]